MSEWEKTIFLTLNGGGCCKQYEWKTALNGKRERESPLEKKNNSIIHRFASKCEMDKNMVVEYLHSSSDLLIKTFIDCA